MRITKPELKVVRFGTEDVIATSNFAVAVGTGYNIYSGAMQYYDPDHQGWYVALDSTPFTTISAEAFESKKTDVFLNPLYGAYYEGGNYYTKGASYVEIAGHSSTDLEGDSGTGGGLDDEGF